MPPPAAHAAAAEPWRRRRGAGGAATQLASKGGLCVAIVDIDVHHGDGTDEIVRRLAATHPSAALVVASIHLYDPGDATFGPFYPASGGNDSMPHNIINVPLTPMWRGGPGSGGGGGRGGGGRGARASSAPFGSPRLCGCGRLEWRQALSSRIVPSLRAFGPDLILLSAGFDGGCGDIGNSKMDVKEKYHQGLDLSAADFEWATAQILSVASVCAPGASCRFLRAAWVICTLQGCSERAGHLAQPARGERGGAPGVPFGRAVFG